MSNNQEFLRDVIAGLSKTHKSLPCKYFYDEQGSKLFEQICQLQEYYITRTELNLLEMIKNQISDLIGAHANIIEPGSRASEKIQVLLQALNKPKSFTPLDISKEIYSILLSCYASVFYGPRAGVARRYRSLARQDWESRACYTNSAICSAAKTSPSWRAAVVRMAQQRPICPSSTS